MFLNEPSLMSTGAHLGNPTCHGTGCFLVSKSRSIVYPKITCQKVSKWHWLNLAPMGASEYIQSTYYKAGYNTKIGFCETKRAHSAKYCILNIVYHLILDNNLPLFLTPFFKQDFVFLLRDLLI